MANEQWFVGYRPISASCINFSAILVASSFLLLCATMSDRFEGAFQAVDPQQAAELEARFRERHPDLAADEQKEESDEVEAEEIEGDNLSERYHNDDSDRYRYLTAREQQRRNEGHLSADGRLARMQELERELNQTSTEYENEMQAIDAAAEARRADARQQRQQQRQQGQGSRETNEHDRQSQLPNQRQQQQQRNQETSSQSANAGGNSNNNDDSTGRRELQNPIRVDQMRDGVVDPGVYSRYVNEIIHFLNWVKEKKPTWMTELGKSQHQSLTVLIEGEKPRQRQRRIKDAWMKLVQNSDSAPIIHIEQMTPEGIMEYISIQAHQRTGRMLSKAGYGGKRSAIKHLVRCHWGKVWDEEFETKLELLWKGFMRLSTNEQTATARRRRGRAREGTTTTTNNGTGQQGDSDMDDASIGSEHDNNSDDNDRDLFQEGKTPMTPELFRCVCKWFFLWGTMEGIFAACLWP